MKEDKCKKKHRYTYYTVTRKEEIEVDEKWYTTYSEEYLSLEINKISYDL